MSGHQKVQDIIEGLVAFLMYAVMIYIFSTLIGLTITTIVDILNRL